MNQQRDSVSLGPAAAVPPTQVDLRGGVAALLGAQEPLLGRRHQPQPISPEGSRYPTWYLLGGDGGVPLPGDATATSRAGIAPRVPRVPAGYEGAKIRSS